MGLFGSLFTGVSALFAQSQNTAIISNNIANVSTTGYKRGEAAFNSLVTTQSRLSTYSPGTVTATRLQRVDQQGSIQQTASSTDAAISGNGMFPVRRSTDFGQENLYTRAGQFSEDAEGLLRNASNFILYAWPIDADGNLPANQGDLSSLVPADVAFLGGLTRPTTTAELAINLDADQTQFNNDIFPTPPGPSTLPIPSDQAAHFSRGLTVFDSLGSAQTMTLEFRKIQGPMANASTQIGSLMLNTDPFLPLSPATPSINHNDAFTIELVGADGQQYSDTFRFVDPASAVPVLAGRQVTTMQDVLDAVSTISDFGGTNTTTGSILSATQNENGQIIFKATDPTASIEFTEVTGNPISVAGSLFIANDVDTTRASTTATFIDGAGNVDTATAMNTLQPDIGLADNVTITVSGVAPQIINNVGTLSAAAYVTAINTVAFPGGEIVASIQGGRIVYEVTDPTTTFTVVGTGTSTSTVNGLGVASNPYVFEPEAPIQPTATDGISYGAQDPYTNQDDFPGFTNPNTPNTEGWWEMTILHPNGSTISQGLLNFDGDGSLNANRNADNQLEIALTGIDWFNGSDPQAIDIDIERFSQFAGNYDVIFSDQNGAELGLRTGVEISREGIVSARFSNGASSDLYKIPLVTFANVNGLNEVSGTAYSETEDSGEENLREAGQGGAGFVEPSTLEASNVDLADEFARLIVSQRAYGAATRTINTVDQMTQDLLSLRG